MCFPLAECDELFPSFSLTETADEESREIEEERKI